jgi:hypothetical protein
MLFPSLLLATTPLERRPSSIAAHCRRPPRPGHPGPPLAELRLGIGPRRHPPSFPLAPAIPEAQGRRPSAANALGGLPCFQRGGRRKKGANLPQAPSFPSYLVKSFPPN